MHKTDHKSAAIWAADCAARVLFLFEKSAPQDARPRQAIEAARAWARGEFSVAQARAAAFAAHAAARDTVFPMAKAAARAAGHAAATAHVATHARHAATYALKAIAAAPDLDAEMACERERKWQLEQFFQLPGAQ